MTTHPTAATPTTAAPETVETVDLTRTVADLLDLTVTDPDPGAGVDPERDEFAALAGFALRDNPRRAHLIVSQILGKHIPANPGVVLDGGYRLATKIVDTLGDMPTGDTLAIGYCETATGLGHAVAEDLAVTYLHTTRRPDAALPVQARFDEEHSHAVAHLIQPRPGISLAGTGPLILIDDELTTGKTALNTIEALHAQFPRPVYVIAVLLDARTPAARAAFETRVAAMGLDVRVASVFSAYLDLPDDILDRAIRARQTLPAPAPAPSGAPAPIRIHPGLWPTAAPAVTARHGMVPQETVALVMAARDVAHRLVPVLSGSRSILVLGTEELLHTPTHLAATLARRMPEALVRNQSTTRSPVHAADDPGYAIRRTVSFPAPDDPTRVSRVHNLYHPAAVPSGARPWSDLRFDDLVVVADADVDACAPMLAALAPYAARGVHLVTVPATTSLPLQ